MLSPLALAFAGLCVAAIFLSALWAERRFDRFAKLPARFDMQFRATRLAPARLVIWSTPAIAMGVIGLIIFLVTMTPSEQINGDPDVTLALSAALVLGAQFFVLWLLVRWARAHGPI
ncbi:MAG: hypothetical protein WA918_11715 [Erythrobacter sp.]